MKIILGNVYQPTLEGASVRITRSMTDPVPTCSINLRDNTSAIQVQAMQELLVLDDQVIPNPTTNQALNPSLNPFGTNWTSFSGSGLTLSQNGGGGIVYTFSNCTIASGSITSQNTPTGSVTAGQTYTFSVYVQGGSSPTNIGAAIGFSWIDAAGNTLGLPITQLGPIPASSSLVRFTCSGTAPAGASAANLFFGYQRSSTTNSGTITYTQVQFEPNWFPSVSYPTTWCGPAQTNCQMLPLGYWIRQYRKFAGFVPKSTAANYIGNARTLNISAVGYAWLMGIISCNNSYTSKTDSFILNDLTSTYMTNLVSTTNVITGVTVSNLQSNWDDLRTLADGLAALSSSYWTIGYYWELIYAPPGYLAMPISLICDGSGTPDNITTFPAYNFSADSDYTQPGSQILVIGAGTSVARVIDPSTIAQNAIVSGYTLPNLTTGGPFWRKVNDSTLNSVADCTQRGMAELLQYDYPRGIYHLTTNVELLPGESIQVTSNTDNLNKSTLLIQQVTAQWLGTNETLTDEWAYSADLGATNRSATNILSRIHRITQKNTSAPAISATTLAVFETIGMVDTAATASVSASYVQVVQGDGPVGYYRLSNLEGTVADDWSGNNNKGTINASPTLGVATLLTDAAAADTSDLAITFASASSQYITLPASMVPTGASPWSLECWFKIPSVPANATHQTLMGWGAASGAQKFGVLNLASNGTNCQLVCSTNSGDITSGNLSTGTIYYAVGTYDGTNTRLYLGSGGSVSLVAGPTPFTLSLTQTLCTIGAYTPGAYASSFFSGTIDECAFYTFALSSGQISAHYAAGI